jgi:hypothetical protein
MKPARKMEWRAAAVAIFGLLLGGMWGLAVEYETIQAVAMGQSTQLGQRFNVTIVVYEFSTTDEQKALLDAFNAAGQQGLYNAVTKMKAKGHMAITGTLGYDINYIKEFKLPDGSRKIRLVTDRPLRFGEMWSDSRSTDYTLSAAEINLGTGKDNSSGILMPALKIKIDPKTDELKLETLQNPWKLINITDYLPKEK